MTSADGGTQAERDEYLRAGFRPVRCDDCGGTVTVRKSSPTQTSVQWHSNAADECPFFAAAAGQPRSGALVERCPELAESIQKAVANGQIPNGPG